MLITILKGIAFYFCVYGLYNFIKRFIYLSKTVDLLVSKTRHENNIEHRSVDDRIAYAAEKGYYRNDLKDEGAWENTDKYDEIMKDLKREEYENN
jgi:hypothetical protein